ncbi:hypothetical protein B0H13DRAFT_2300898 [Mycena leptocephala]|nr:hypothetical protein B0H13DRAFT_2300898 [Mycena leptocephala]
MISQLDNCEQHLELSPREARAVLVLVSGRCCRRLALSVQHGRDRVGGSRSAVCALGRRGADARGCWVLNPKDPQDVPRAVKLLSLVTEMRHLDSSEFTPSEWKTHRALCLLGEMFDPLLEPFINPTLSLSDQITHLVKFAHLACAIFLKHETDFVSNQLYGDVQCMVKNAIPYNYDQIDTGCDA